jgi:D-sedoheptulose 7-phosphate isomerase
MSHARTFLDEVVETDRRIEPETIETLCNELASLRDRQGRLFIIGVGGSAGNCSHAVNDIRKLCGIEAYAPTDNVSELTARTNDEGWPTVFSEWLKVSRANAKDAILVFSVGGGNLEKNVSPNIVSAIKVGKEHGLKVFGIDGRARRATGGYIRLIRADDNEIARLFEPTHRIFDAWQETELSESGRRHRFAVALEIGVDHAVTIEKDGRPHHLVAFRCSFG